RSVVYCDDKIEAATGADALALMTEWRQFRLPNWCQTRGVMRGNVVVDGRNIYNQQELENEGFIYRRIGKKLH
ncbi:MAG: UDP binding domain-containing protein, partial [Mucinivorans sp.]